MSPLTEHNDQGEFSNSESDSDDEFREELDALSKACMRIGANPNDLNLPSSAAVGAASDSDGGESSDIDDLELLSSLGQKLGISAELEQPLTLKPLRIMPPGIDDDDDDKDNDDFETLRAIQMRFTSYDSNALKSSTEDHLEKPAQVRAFSIPFEKETPNNLCVDRTNACEGFPDFEEPCVTSQNLEPSRYNVPIIQTSADALKSSTEDHLEKPAQVRAFSIPLEKETPNNLCVDRTNACEGFPDFEEPCVTSQNLEPSRYNVPIIQTSAHIEWHQADAGQLLISPLKSSSFPKSAQMFIDAITKNRSCQKLLRSKLTLIEARIEENKKLKERVKILKDFQVSCKRRSGRALSQKKDLRVQLFSTQKFGASKDSKVSDKKASAMRYGPSENSHVENYRMALTKFPLSFGRLKWSSAERENLRKGIKQEFQKALLEKSVDLFSGSEGFSENSDDIDNIIASIKDLEITPENIRLYLPKVDWDHFASIHVKDRSGAECEARWLNYEDPLINHNPWTHEEDKFLLLNVREVGLNNWIHIAVSLGTNRTPFQCLARFQRSLNACIIKREWTKDEDAQLCTAVEAFGESNWQLIASSLEGRTGTQCSNRWKKSLHPARKRVGRWTLDEDKRLKVAVMLCGPKTWQKIAQFVPGRTQVQCRERWANSLDPSLSWDEWTEDEDRRLLEAIEAYHHCWSKIAARVPPRTDNQCRRRWKYLCPNEVPLLQAERIKKKTLFITNFVDRESERPELRPEDFVPLPLINSTAESGNVTSSRKAKRKSRGKREKNDIAFCNIPKKIRTKRPRKEVQNRSKKVSEIETIDRNGNSFVMITNTEEVEASNGHDSTPKSLELGMNNVGVDETSNGNNVTSTKKKRAGKRHDTAKVMSPRPHTKRRKSTEPGVGSQSLLLHPQSSESGNITGDCVQTCGDTTASNKRKRAFSQHSNVKKRSIKPQLNMSKCTELDENQPVPLQSLDPKKRAPKNHPGSIGAAGLEKHQSFTLSSGQAMVLNTTVGTDCSSLGGSNTTTKRGAPKLQVKRRYTKSSAPENSPKVTSSNRKKPAPKQLNRRKSKASDENQDVASISCREDELKKSGAKDKFGFTEILGELTEDDIPLVSFFKKK